MVKAFKKTKETAALANFPEFNLQVGKDALLAMQMGEQQYPLAIWACVLAFENGILGKESKGVAPWDSYLEILKASKGRDVSKGNWQAQAFQNVFDIPFTTAVNKQGTTTLKTNATILQQAVIGKALRCAVALMQWGGISGGACYMDGEGLGRQLHIATNLCFDLDTLDKLEATAKEAKVTLPDTLVVKGGDNLSPSKIKGTGVTSTGFIALCNKVLGLDGNTRKGKAVPVKAAENLIEQQINEGLTRDDAFKAVLDAFVSETGARIDTGNFTGLDKEERQLLKTAQALLNEFIAAIELNAASKKNIKDKVAKAA